MNISCSTVYPESRMHPAQNLNMSGPCDQTKPGIVLRPWNIVGKVGSVPCEIPYMAQSWFNFLYWTRHHLYLIMRFYLNPCHHSPFFHIMSLPQVTLNLLAQVTWDLTMRRHTPSPRPPPHHICHRALDTASIDTINFNIVYVPCQVCNYI